VKHGLRTPIRVAGLRAWRRLGAVGLGGALLLLAALSLAVLTPRLVAHNQAQAQRLAQWQAEPARPVAPATAPPAVEPLDPLGSALPTLAHNAADLDQLFALARTHRITLQRGDYQFAQEPHAALLTYSITLPVHQTYATIKQFSADVLRALPHAALDELRLERIDSGSADLDARLRFTLFYRSR
jgi:hypothetical protein